MCEKLNWILFLVFLHDLNITITKPNGCDTVKEGDSVNLTCIKSCNSSDHSNFTWSKNGESIVQGPVLYLRNVSSTNSGNYTCSLKTHKGTASEVIHVDVEYAPRKTSVSVTPLAEADVGHNVTLFCSSHANPPVQNYIWFKMNNTDAIVAGHQPELHLERVLQGDDAEYFCMATNKHGNHNSSTVTLKTKGRQILDEEEAQQPAYQLPIFIVASVAALLFVITLVAIKRQDIYFEIKSYRASL
ncbi:B-cell receptor CD22-like isoform 2-T4 [Pholidichthys leucotaenia]